jgi:hypothetical protein
VDDRHQAPRQEHEVQDDQCDDHPDIEQPGQDRCPTDEDGSRTQEDYERNGDGKYGREPELVVVELACAREEE